MKTVVTGATGRLGRHVVEGLLAVLPASQLAVVVRDKAKADPLAEQGVEVRIADYDDPTAVSSAFGTDENVLLISGSEMGRRVPQHRAVIEACVARGAGRLAYTSILGAPTADFELAREHQETERLILESGLPYVLLRNGWYHENYTENLEPVLASGEVVACAGSGRVASAARADYAAAAVAVLTSEGHTGRAYELSGDVAWSLDEYAAQVASLAGRPVGYRPVEAEAYVRLLESAGVPPHVASTLADADAAVARGRLATTTGDLSRLIGRPTTPLSSAIAAALG